MSGWAAPSRLSYPGIHLVSSQAELIYFINDRSASTPLNFPWSRSFYLCCEDVCCPVIVLPFRCLSVSDSRFCSKILSICRRRISTPPERRRVVEQGKRFLIPKHRQMNQSTVTGHYSFHLRQRQLLGKPSENIDALPGCTNNYRSRTLRSRHCRARALFNSPPVRTYIHPRPF